MSRTDLVALLERGAGPPPHRPDADALWRRGRRRRRAKQLAAAGGVAVVAVSLVAVQPLWEGASRQMEIAPTDMPASIELPDVVVPDNESERAELPMLDQQTGSLLVATYDGSVTFVDVDRLQVTQRPMPQLAPGDPPQRLMAGDRLVLYGGERIYAMDPHPDADPQLILEQPDFSVFVPSGVADRLWVRTGRTDGSPAPISQITVDGAVLIGPIDSPGGNLAIGLRDTVVLQGDAELVVWNPQTDQIVQRLPGPFPMGSDGDRFAWCNQTCDRLHLTGPATGSDTLLAELPEGASFSGYQGQLSPDGRFLASPVCVDRGRRCALAVLDLDAERVMTIADGWLTSSAAPAWSPDSRWVFVPMDDGRIAAYRPGGPEAAVVGIEGIDTPFGFGVLHADVDPEVADTSASPDVEAYSSARR